MSHFLKILRKTFRNNFSLLNRIFIKPLSFYMKYNYFNLGSTIHLKYDCNIFVIYLHNI